MCFSPAASFTTAAVTAAAGIYALVRVGQRSELPFAAFCISAGGGAGAMARAMSQSTG